MNDGLLWYVLEVFDGGRLRECWKKTGTTEEHGEPVRCRTSFEATEWIRRQSAERRRRFMIVQWDSTWELRPSTELVRVAPMHQSSAEQSMPVGEEVAE
jgi:hypothetical protein